MSFLINFYFIPHFLDLNLKFVKPLLQIITKIYRKVQLLTIILKVITISN